MVASLVSESPRRANHAGRARFRQAQRPVRLRAHAGRFPDVGGVPVPAGRWAVDVRSAGSLPVDQVYPSAVAAMAEVGIDISRYVPKVLSTNDVHASDVAITIGCGNASPIFPGKRYLDWDLEDPAGKGVGAVLSIRDEIKTRVQARCRPTHRVHAQAAVIRAAY